jgi:hypothetical protein
MKYLLFIFFVLTSTAYAEKNMRRCALLPITDPVEGAIGFKIYGDVEAVLRSSSWCAYTSNSQILSVFAQYRDKLDQYIENPELIKVVADRLNVGSIIRAYLEKDARGLKVILKVFGDDGKTLYFFKEERVDGTQIDQVISLLKQWLDDYSKTIPYDALVAGVLGDQVTMDVASAQNVVMGHGFSIRKLKEKKLHPLFKQVVSYESTRLGHGKIFNQSEQQVVGAINQYEGSEKIAVGDWVVFDIEPAGFTKEDFDKNKKDDFSKLGYVRFLGEFGNYSVKTQVGNQSKKSNGIIPTLAIDGEVWITRNYFSGLEFARGIGNLKKKTDTVVESSSSLSPTRIKLWGGYRYLPMGFFFGPQLDFYGGYANYLYDLDYSQTDAYGTSSFSGLLAGLRFDMPMTPKVRGYVRAEFIPFGTAKDDDNLFGGEKSMTNLMFDLGGRYQINGKMAFDGSLQIVSNSAKFKGSNRELQYQTTLIRFGVLYFF